MSTFRITGLCIAKLVALMLGELGLNFEKSQDKTNEKKKLTVACHPTS